ELSIFLGDGQGGFVRTETLDAGSAPVGLTVADVDGDGRLDLLVGNGNGDVLTLLGRGDGTFEPYQRLDRHMGLAVADLNNDGQSEFVFANEALDAVTVQTAATPDFQQGRSDGVLDPNAVKTADLNGDGIPDLVVANGGSNNILVYLGLGNGRFAAAQR